MSYYYLAQIFANTTNSTNKDEYYLKYNVLLSRELPFRLTVWSLTFELQPNGL